MDVRSIKTDMPQARQGEAELMTCIIVSEWNAGLGYFDLVREKIQVYRRGLAVMNSLRLECENALLRQETRYSTVRAACASQLYCIIQGGYISCLHPKT